MNDTTYGAITGMECHPNAFNWYSQHDIDCNVENGYAITYCKRCGKIIETKLISSAIAFCERDGEMK